MRGLGYGSMGVPNQDPAAVRDTSQVRLDVMRTDVAGLGDDADNAPVDPTTGLQVVTVTGTPTPVWPLLIALAVVGYALFKGGKHA